MAILGVNIDHIATLRQARKESLPDPVKAIEICERAGASSIVAHLREDRRHINDRDVQLIKKIVTTRFNLEMSLNDEIVEIACRVKPQQATLVPERRLEVTTEGGLDVIRHFKKIQNIIGRLQRKNIAVSLFIDPVEEQIAASKKAGASIIELHTGQYSLARTKAATVKELKKIYNMTALGVGLGLEVNAGHGLKYHNSMAVAKVPGMHELNIGHSIISYAVFVGLERAVKEMVKIIKS